MKKVWAFLKNAKWIILILAFIIPIIKDAIELSWDNSDYEHNKSRELNVEVVPTFDKDISLWDILNDHKLKINYDIYFMNNTVNDVSISDISYYMGFTFKDLETDFKEDRNQKGDAATLSPGSNYVISVEQDYDIPFEYLKSLVPDDENNGSLGAIDTFLMDDFNGSQGMLFRVYYKTDSDYADKNAIFAIQYDGCSDKSLIDWITIEDSFTVIRTEYKD